jgi:signal peptidase I
LGTVSLKVTLEQPNVNEAGPLGRPDAVGGSPPLSDTLRETVDARPDKELLPDANTRRRRKRSNGSKLLIEWVVLIVSALTIALLIKTFLFQAFVIPSESMEPTLHGCTGCQDDRILVNKLSYRLHDVNRGDIVVFDAPEGRATDEIKDYVKRVIGLPNEEIESRNGQVFVDGKPLDEPYINEACSSRGDLGAAIEPQTIPAGHVFVMGDNRCQSSDSRVFGPIDTDTIVGRAFVRIWPLSRFKFL